jgi:hypothetical protein
MDSTLTTSFQFPSAVMEMSNFTLRLHSESLSELAATESL